MQKLLDRAIKSDARPSKSQDAVHVGCRSPFSNVRHAAAHFRRAGGDDRAALIYFDWEYYISFHKANGGTRTRHHNKKKHFGWSCARILRKAAALPLSL